MQVVGLNNLLMSQVLIDAGADVDYLSPSGASALDRARQTGGPEGPLRRDHASTMYWPLPRRWPPYCQHGQGKARIRQGENLPDIGAGAEGALALGGHDHQGNAIVFTPSVQLRLQ